MTGIDHDALERIPVIPEGPLPLDSLSALLELLEHTAEHLLAEVPGGDIPGNVGDLRLCVSRDLSEETVAHLAQCWGAACAAMAHMRETTSMLSAVDSIRLVVGRHGGHGGTRPTAWQKQLITLI